MHPRELKLSAELVPIKKTSSVNVYLTESGGEKFIIKELLTSDVRKRMERSQKLLAKILESNPNFPCVLAKKSTTLEKREIYIEKFIDGISLSRKIFCGNDAKIICNNLVNYLRLLRTIRGFDEERATVDWKNFLEGYVTTKTLPSSLFKVCDPMSLDRFLTYIQKSLSEIHFGDSVSLVHNDLNAGNILVQKDLKIFVIDYEWWIFGDPLKDLSKMIWYFRQFPDFGKIFRATYINEFGEFDENILKFYFAVDILNHLSQYEALIYSAIWKVYFEQEFEIIRDIWREGFCLWS